MKPPRRPVWSEGMLLSPQHLQALDRYHESLLAARVAALAPVDFGVVSLEVDPAALAGGQLRVLRFAGVLPDGLVVSFDDGDPEAPPPRAVADHFPPAARSVDVFLAVPRERDGVSAFAEDASSQARFAVSSRPIEDATAPGAPLQVSVARPNVVVLFADESREDHESIKIAELVRAPAGHPAVAETYVPPALKVGASPWLLGRLREVTTRLVARQREIADMRRSREAGSGEMSAQDVIRSLQLLVLDGNVPVFAHLADAPDTLPRDAYLWLVRLAGELCAFGDADPAALPKFDHADLRATFEPLFAQVLGALGGMGAVRYVSVPLEQRAGGLHLARIQDDRHLQGALYLAVKSDLPEQQVIDAVPRLCKIASAAEIQSLLQAAAPGLAVTWLPRTPAELPVRAGTSYFAVATGDRYWQSILVNRTIAIYLPPPFDPARTKVELLSVPPAAAPGAPPSPAVPPRRPGPDIRRY